MARSHFRFRWQIQPPARRLSSTVVGATTIQELLAGSFGCTSLAIRGTTTVAAAAGGWHNRPLIDAHSTWGRWSNRPAGQRLDDDGRRRIAWQCVS
ncbi:hypothetical protein ASPBRDRAFT_594627 [Aspergillus brasiliensis CBS 101740]|uniref:Uncharacterized protein n=1 Tax=Aspergillus brasiliensis (strain CBS 101740 / IMI 381727 / IBT 21946) TaxID=767769 RepID=A0A1L9UGR9_ASPBC|nr:hypothetical protein ASPBRDRAFT_594627 [Aspergillus brasiliensis CBS 101740]